MLTSCYAFSSTVNHWCRRRNLSFWNLFRTLPSKMELFTKIVNDQKVLSILPCIFGSVLNTPLSFAIALTRHIVQYSWFSFTFQTSISKKDKATIKLSYSYNSNTKSFAVYIFDLVALFHDINNAEASRCLACFIVFFYLQLIIAKYVNDCFSFFYWTNSSFKLMLSFKTKFKDLL